MVAALSDATPLRMNRSFAQIRIALYAIAVTFALAGAARAQQALPGLGDAQVAVDRATQADADQYAPDLIASARAHLEQVCQRWLFSSRHMQAAPPGRFRAQLVAAFLESLDEALGGFFSYAVTMTPPSGFWYAIHWDEIAFELGDERYLLHFSHSD